MAQPLSSGDPNWYSDRMLVELLVATPENRYQDFADSLLRIINAGHRLTPKQRDAAFRILAATRGVRHARA